MGWIAHSIYTTDDEPIHKSSDPMVARLPTNDDEQAKIRQRKCLFTSSPTQCTPISWGNV